MSETTTAVPLSATRPGSLFARYSVEHPELDEFLRGDSPNADAWKLFRESLQQLGANAFDRRWVQARRTLGDQGVTYRVYGENAVDGADMPWRLDPVPLMVADTEWNALGRGLRQRARLLNHILADLYGAQSLLRRGLLPADLVYGSAAFLRPCAGVPVPRNDFLHVYAADLGRNADGAWCVVGDRTQAPSGAGYALENRTIMASMLNESFAHCRVQRLATFFRQLRETLQVMAPRRRDEPEIVLLTPGPANETYFEHVFLARYLGFKLVQGTDLMARDGRVYLKTLQRPLQVDVILRRLDDSFCDSLELRRDSVIGVPGLLQAVRQGNVAIANALGAAWAESPALAEYLPAICKEVFGEDLIAPQVRSRWLGRAENLAYALEHMESLVFKPTFGHLASPPVFGMALSREERAAYAERLRAQATNWVAQELLPLSTMPNWIDMQMQPRRIGCRAFLTRADSDYIVMDGGLGRVTSEADGYVISMQSGGGSKDIWVAGEQEPDPVSLLPAAGQDPPLKRSGFVLSSRVADDMYWLGRYVERGEFLARILRWVYSRIESEQGTGVPDLQHLIRYLSTLEYLSQDAALDSVESVETTLSEILSGNDPGKLRSILLTARGIANRLRDRISMDAWRLTRLLGSGLLPPVESTEAVRTADALEQLNHLLHTTAAFSGIVSENMIRDPGWTFLDCGRRLERAFQSLTLLQSCLVTVSDKDLAGVLNAILEIHDSGMTYRTRYLHTVHFGPALDLVLTDESNPRSVAYQLVAIEAYTRQLPMDPGVALRPLHQRLAMNLLTNIRLVDPTELVKATSTRGRRLPLQKTLRSLRSELMELSDALVQRYFSYAIGNHQLP